MGEKVVRFPLIFQIAPLFVRKAEVCRNWHHK